MRDNRAQSGFTLIELMVVVAIIGILCATCLQIFIALRNRGYDARANEDLRNVASAEEAYFATNASYTSCASTAACTLSLPGIKALSPGVTLEITATTSGFIGTSSHPKGSGITYRWNSLNGGMAG